MLTLCSNPRCDNAVEPYATDGGDFYRTEDGGGMCAECNLREACDEERRGSLSDESDTGEREALHGTVRGMVAR